LSASSVTRYYLSADGQKGSGDTLLIGSRQVRSLTAGASHAGPAVPVTLPSTTAVNTYYLLACADDRDIVAEMDNSNNCRAATTTVQVTRPDLVITVVSNPPPSVARGGHFAVSDTIQNQGAVSSESSRTRYYLSVDGEKGSGDTLLIGTRVSPVLAAGASSSGPAISVTIPSTTPPGLHYLLACADDVAVVIETDENNNCKASSSRVTVGPELHQLRPGRRHPSNLRCHQMSPLGDKRTSSGPISQRIRVSSGILER
jgi:subtilase family serine protease